MAYRPEEKPIGVFDSGLGGLTALKELRRLLPGESLVYFGDTARVPYGTRDKETILRYSKQDVQFLLEQDVKMILCACNTVSSALPEEYRTSLGVPFVGVVEHAALAAVQRTKNGKIGIIGTTATIASGSYEKALKALENKVQVTAMACPLFVPLVENGYFGKQNEVVRLVAKEYLTPLKMAGVDTLILGCTHYPLLKDVIADIMGEDVRLIDSGKEGARFAQHSLMQQKLLNPQKEQGSCRFYASSAQDFTENAGRFLGENLSGQVKQVAIDSYEV